jgi:flagellar motor switch protein FliG
MSEPPANIRKAAILVSAIDSRTAELLLTEMGAAEAAAVRRAAAALGDLSDNERDAVLAEFGSLAAQAESTLARLRPDQQAAGIDLCGDQVPLAPQACLEQADGETLAEYLSREQPQTIALLFTRMPPHQAADVLGRLPDGLQAEVVQRLATTESANPQVLRDVEQEVKAWLHEHQQRGRRASAGAATATRVLDASGQSLRQSVLANLARRDAALARRLAGSPVRPQTAPVDVTA